MLFDVSKDMGEVRNIAKREPELHNRLFDEMMSYLKKVGARFPKENPDYDAEFYGQMKGYELHQMWGPFEDRRPLEDDE